MEEEKKKMPNLQKKSHEVLLKLLNNVGIVGSILAGIADIIFVIIFVVGMQISIKRSAAIIFAVINALIGILINILLRYQGQKYAEIENEELCNKFYRKKVKENKKHLSMGAWQILKSIKDIPTMKKIVLWGLCILMKEKSFSIIRRAKGFPSIKSAIYPRSADYIKT